jgi:3-deoxy-D-manno-octulosonate 8-phosphate phosphatase (KDO 8-P phosphatase)
MIDASLARRIKLVGLDVDGVLTDGGIYLGDVDGARGEFKRYDIQDGLGIKFLRDAGMKVVIITGRVSESVRHRADELEVDALVQDSAAQKLPAFRSLLDTHGFSPEQAAFVGDDFPDVSVLREVGLPVAVGNAVPEVRAICKLQLSRHGGSGAVREFAELLLKARGEWETVTGRYVQERSLPPAKARA